MKNEIIIFENQNIKLEVNLKDETVWLTANQMAKLFKRDYKTIRKHINNAFDEELEINSSTIANFATVKKEGNREVIRNIQYYNLDVIISVGYRVRSTEGTKFRKWATTILKDHLLKGYSINKQRLEMCKIAFSSINNLTVSDWEIKNFKNKISYTYKTIEHFRKIYPNDQLFFLIGSDRLQDFKEWENWQYILQNVTLVVGSRNDKKIQWT